MSIAKALEEASQYQVRFWNRQDSELLAERAKLWGEVEKEIGKLVDERIKQQSTLRLKGR
jgi:hypothetical protein